MAKRKNDFEYSDSDSEDSDYDQRYENVISAHRRGQRHSSAGQSGGHSDNTRPSAKKASFS